MEPSPLPLHTNYFTLFPNHFRFLLGFREVWKIWNLFNMEIDLTDDPSSLILQCFWEWCHKFCRALRLSSFPSMAIHIPQLHSFHNPRSHGTSCPSFFATIKNFFQKQLTIFHINYNAQKIHQQILMFHSSFSGFIFSKCFIPGSYYSRIARPPFVCRLPS